jgi:hypothetical protein
MHMAEADFWGCTPRYFMRRRKAFLQNRNGMEEARFVSFNVMKAAGAKIRRVQQICRFPWDVVERRVKLEAWDSPAMLKFDREADEALKILNPEAYAKYMEGKAAREQQSEVAAKPPDDMRIDAEIDF